MSFKSPITLAVLFISFLCSLAIWGKINPRKKAEDDYALFFSPQTHTVSMCYVAMTWFTRSNSYVMMMLCYDGPRMPPLGAGPAYIRSNLSDLILGQSILPEHLSGTWDRCVVQLWSCCSFIRSIAASLPIYIYIYIYTQYIYIYYIYIYTHNIYIYTYSIYLY